MNSVSRKEKDFDGITINDLQEQHQQYAEIIGVTNLIMLSVEFGGLVSREKTAFLRHLKG